jgi:small subunit ribosomal protein S20
MANHKSTEKRIRQDEGRKTNNKYYSRSTRNALKKLRATTDKSAAADLLPEVSSMLDKLAKKNIIHPNKAANLKSKLTRQVNGLASAK